MRAREFVSPPVGEKLKHNNISSFSPKRCLKRVVWKEVADHHFVLLTTISFCWPTIHCATRPTLASLYFLGRCDTLHKNQMNERQLIRQIENRSMHKNDIFPILERVFCTPVNSLPSSLDSITFASSQLPNTYVCHRTLSSERECKECGVRRCIKAGTCCSRCATKTIKNRGI